MKTTKVMIVTECNLRDGKNWNIPNGDWKGNETGRIRKKIKAGKI